MVLTLKFDKNSQRYITFNLQRLSRTVLVYHFKKESYVNFKLDKSKFLKTMVDSCESEIELFTIFA